MERSNKEIIFRQVERITKERMYSQTTLVIGLIRSKFDRERQLRGERQRTCRGAVLDIALCVLVRLILIVVASFWLYYIVGITGNYYYLASGVLILLIGLDGLYLCLYRLGKDHTWFHASFFLFSLASQVPIWAMSVIKTNMPSNNCPNRTDELAYVNNFYMSVSPDKLVNTD